MDLNQTLAAYAEKFRETNLETYFRRAYDWQVTFHNACMENGLSVPDRLAMAANGVGKTYIGGAETAMHLMEIYPDERFADENLARLQNIPVPDGEPNWENWKPWWHGKRFDAAEDQGITVWVGSIDNQKQKEDVQPILLGQDIKNMGTGYLYPDKILSTSKRQAGVDDVIDTAIIQGRKYKNHLAFKTYEQGWRKWQGKKVHFAWLDEQIDENALNEKKIFSELQTRTFRADGSITATLTPLLGKTNMIEYFEDDSERVFFVSVGWDKAPHLDVEARAHLMKTYPAHELDARTKGIPMLGEGAVFPIAPENITCDPFQIPEHYAQIKGCDFGAGLQGHPGAGARIAWDRDLDIIYVTDCYKALGQTALYHAQWFTASNPRIPVAWPHDGINTEKSGGNTVAQSYRSHRVAMLAKSARYKAKDGETEKAGGQPVEPIVIEILERMMTGRFKVFSHLTQWFDEFGSYHRKDGKIVAKRDDILKATFYAVMMKRFAVPLAVLNTRAVPVQHRPIATTKVA